MATLGMTDKDRDQLHAQGVWKRTGALYETVSRYTRMESLAVLAQGRLQLFGIDLPVGITVTSITFMSATTALSVGVNQWFGLFSNAYVPLRLTADDTSTAWAADSEKTLALTSPFVTTYPGIHYLGISVVATTRPSLAGWSMLPVTIATLAPVLGGNSSTGLTNPASCPNPVTTPTQNGGLVYAYVS